MNKRSIIFACWKWLFAMLIVLTNPALMAQTSGYGQADSCTIQVASKADYFWGWKEGYLQILSQGDIIETIEHHQGGSINHTIKVPADKVISFDWHHSDNSYFSIYSESGELLFASSIATPPGITFSLNGCNAPKKCQT